MSHERWLLAALIAGLAAHFVFGLADEVAPGAKAGLFLWLVLGLLVGSGGTMTTWPCSARSPVAPAEGK